MLTVYQSLLRLYPAAFRRQFSEEMLAVFREVDSDARNRGSFIRARLYFREIRGVLGGALAEYARQMLGSKALFQIPCRRFSMRPGFRFPKTTAFLMTVILAGVVLAIEKAEAIRASMPNVNPPAGPIQPVHLTVLTSMALLFLVVYIAGAVAWVVLFALRRSGVHRLSEILASEQE